MGKIEDKDDLRDEIVRILEDMLAADDPYCGIDGIEDSADEIMDLLKNTFMVFFK